MPNKKNRENDQRRGDTSRTSNQGRKQASGGDVSNNKRGNPEIEENTKNVKSDKLAAGRDKNSEAAEKS